MVVSTDMMIEGKHFDKSYNPKILASKLLRVNLSDLAAMGANPYGVMLNIAVPKKNSVTWVKDFCKGLKKDLKKFKLKLFGGDLSESSKIFLSATIFGFVTKRFHKQSIASEGSHIYVSGNLGDAAVGLDIHKNYKNNLIDEKKKKYFLEKLFFPIPQIKLGKELVGVAEICTDISDGLLNELERISKVSNLQSNIFLSEIPTSNNFKFLIKKNSNYKKANHYAITGGEDYKLLFSVKPKKIDYLKRKKIKNLKRIGFFTKGSGVKIFDKNNHEIKLPKQRFNHF